jgi:GTP-binding protein YchF
MPKLAATFGSKELLPCSINFVDIAGLVKGASKGEGLGNQFLSHIMEVDVILHVIRCFEDDNIIHVNNKIAPIEDFETIIAELMIKDLESLEKREAKLVGLIKKTSDAKAKKTLEEEQKINSELKAPLNNLDLNLILSICKKAKDSNVPLIPLLTSKKFLIAANMTEEQMQAKSFESNPLFQSLVEKFGKERVMPISAKIEEDLSRMSEEEQLEMRQMLELDDAGLNHLILQTYNTLDLITFFTCGPKEIHAWSVKKGTLIPAASAEIHTDLERGFICSEVYNYSDIETLGSEQAIKNAGKFRVEGKEYVVADGDIVHIRFNV